MMAGVKIGTHNGAFHADEVLGCFMLKQLPEYANAEIVRTRDAVILEGCDIVIDVGSKYHHHTKRYDHHQRNFFETMDTLTGVKQHIKLSSAGLIYAHYGKDVIRSILKKELSAEELDLVYQNIYVSFLKEIDAKDNGIDQCDHQLRYRIYTDLSSRVKRLNGSYSDPEADEEDQFKLAFEMVGKEFTDCVQSVTNVWLPTRNIVAEAMRNRYEVDKSGRIVEFTSPKIPWISHLKALENDDEFENMPLVFFVIYPDVSGVWRVQAVPKDEGFKSRHKVIPEFVGVRDEMLATGSGIDDATFVHANGFIGGAKSRDGVLKMAIMSLPEEPKE